MSIQQVCEKFNLKFNELMDMMKYYDNPIKSPIGNESLMYIIPRDGRFYIRKAGVHYGTYATVSDAKKIKRYFQLNGWDKRNIDKACRITGVERCIR